MVLAGILKIQLICNSFWIQCLLSLLPGLKPHLSPQITEHNEWCHTKYVMSLPTSINSPTTYWVSPGHLMSDMKSVHLVRILHTEGSKVPSLQSHPPDPELLMLVAKWPKCGGSMITPLHSVTERNWHPNLGKPILTLLRWTYTGSWQTVQWRRCVGQRGVGVCGASMR